MKQDWIKIGLFVLNQMGDSVRWRLSSKEIEVLVFWNEWAQVLAQGREDHKQTKFFPKTQSFGDWY